VKLKRRRLPHLGVVGRPLFIAFRWHDSLPAQRSFPASNPTSGEAFVTMDRWLDHARCGPTFLRQPAMAQLVPTSIQYGSVSTLPVSLKAATAKRANLLLQRSGEPFWQDESYDRLPGGRPARPPQAMGLPHECRNSRGKLKLALPELRLDGRGQ
jgi:hypothetical protein